MPRNRFKKYAWIAEQGLRYPLIDMCEVLDVSISGYRAWKRGGRPDRKRLTDAQMLALIRAIHAEIRGTELGVIIVNDRDRRTLAWLRECAGDSAIVRVTGTGRLAGNRKPYPTNIAKVLGLPIPKAVTSPLLDLERVRERLAGLKSILKTGKAKAPEGDGV